MLKFTFSSLIAVLSVICIYLLAIANCVEQKQNSQYFAAIVNGKSKNCRLDGCFLICDDTVMSDVCTAKLDISKKKNCILRNCDLVCDGKLIANICHRQNRRLGLSQATMEFNVLQSTSLWPKGRVCYKMDDDVDRSVVHESLSHWSNNTNITFHECPKHNTVRLRGKCCAPCDEYIHFTKRTGCWSFIGYQHGKCNKGGQMLSVGSSCNQGNIIHEIGHALGLLHEHVRPDRDQHVKIFTKNIEPQAISNFDKVSLSPQTSMGLYDYESIMHYGLFAFSKNGKGTMVPISRSGKPNFNIKIGQRDGLSIGDIKHITSIYKNEFLKR